MCGLGKDELESKNLRVCVPHDVDTVDTSVSVQLAGISLEWRWLDLNMMRMSPTIRIIRHPLQTINLLVAKALASLGETRANTSALIHLAVTNHGKLINLHSDLCHNPLNFC